MTDSLLMPDIAEAYRGGMRQLAAGVCLITSADQQQPGGMIATAVTSVSAAPPTLLVCVNRNASMFELIQRSGHFCVNVLAADALGLVDISVPQRVVRNALQQVNGIRMLKVRQWRWMRWWRLAAN